MHLTHRANTLGAEINLAADATIIFPVATSPANTLPFRLICCAGFGGVNRSSDPLIGSGVNGLARTGLCITLDNPVGLYIQAIGIDGLRDPNGTPIGGTALRVTRASPDGKLILRAEVAPPPGASYTLDQCSFEGEPLVGGGPIARRVTMVLFGLGKQIPGRAAQQGQCGTKCCRKPDTSGFLTLVRPAKDCSELTDADWNQEAPATTSMEMAAPAESMPSALDDLKQILSPTRAPVIER
jgi:hypothetical protein